MTATARTATTENTPQITASYPVTMTAALHRSFGDARSSVEIASAPIPSPGPTQVLVKVEAAGIAIGDWLTMQGLPYIARPAYGLARPKLPVLGNEVAGTVVAVGDQVSSGADAFVPGDRVLGFAQGAFAQYAVTEAAHLVRTPDALGTVDAAAIPVSGLTAYRAVVEESGAKAGERVLVLGASGAVGTFAVQIAKAHGMHVTAVASARNADLVARLGADQVVDYAAQDIEDMGQSWDAVIDLAGNRPVRSLRRLLTARGTAVIVGGNGGRVTMGFSRTIRAMLLNPFVKQRLTMLVAGSSQAGLAAVRDMVASGAVIPVIDRTFPLSRFADAMEHIGSRHTQGKSVIVVDG
ncbi:NAD(P)-dependent alcohol dehydrogenase [Demequina sp. NBRC 110053]|uniref:NAD(P)-dependent alcohol dehydrogenase n=1 Tax=Demequina sp. NBRC 110053 TaxID=1570342 RepID=UPI000A048EA3|nr:NAD(P)-dependent alcohol dehydrogenase [Demequina sp. NBRC 110053]